MGPATLYEQRKEEPSALNYSLEVRIIGLGSVRFCV